VYSRKTVTMVLLGLVMSFGVLLTVSLMDSQGTSLPRGAFTPSNEYTLQFSTFLGGTDRYSQGLREREL